MRPAEHPGLRFDLGSMTKLALADSSMAGLVAWYSLIHVPDDELSLIFAHFRRVLRPGGPVLLGFHVGDESRLKTWDYGGHPMRVFVHRRRHDQMIAWLNDVGFAAARPGSQGVATGSLPRRALRQSLPAGRLRPPALDANARCS